MASFIPATLLVLGIIGAIGTFVSFFQEKTYGSSLEQYILDHNPQHTGDVERLTVEYNMKASRGQL